MSWEGLGWPMRRDADRHGGFTLIETLVALAIVAIALSAAMRASSVSTDAVITMKTRTAANWVAGNVVHRMMAEKEFPELGAREGKSVQGRTEFIWRYEVSVTPNYSFRRVEVKVFEPQDTQHSVARLVSYVARQ